MLIPQRKEGQGRLVSRQELPQEYEVAYRLNIITNMLSIRVRSLQLRAFVAVVRFERWMAAPFRWDTTICTLPRKLSTSKIMG